MRVPCMLRTQAARCSQQSALQTSSHVLRDLQASMRAPCVGCRPRDTPRWCAAHACAGRTLADGLDLPNASRTNKTFRSGLARGARRQASAELLRAWMAWAGGVLCYELLAAPSPSFFPSRVPPGWELVSLLHLLQEPVPLGAKSGRWVLDTCCLGKPNRAEAG